jgi:hypothetical protein
MIKIIREGEYGFKLFCGVINWPLGAIILPLALGLLKLDAVVGCFTAVFGLFWIDLGGGFDLKSYLKRIRKVVKINKKKNQIVNEEELVLLNF